ncbi:MAG: rhodanese-like domain-containing protein [Armatimonadetes bacterium]|nr:MAG: rhodanese-like domain-containing protein [Armatimonadota bacterium]
MRMGKVLIGILALFGLSACELQDATAQQKTVTPREVYEQRTRKDVVIIDVRTPEEFQMERIREAQNKPLQTIQEWVNTLPKDKKIYFVCRSGNRSAQAQRIAQQAGYENTYNMQGGMLAWKREGLPVVSGR